MLALGLNIVVGFAGLLDLGYIAFYAVGAYMYALLASPHLTSNFAWIAQTFPNGLHNSIWLIVPLGAGLAAVFGILLGAPVLKLRGDYLAIVTLGFGEIIRIFLNNLNAPVNITNGPQGITLIDPISIGGVSLAKTQTLFGIQLPSVYLYYSSRWSPSSSACACRTRASDAPGWRSAKTNWRRRRWASTCAT